ncbi:MAG: hypothetical protein JNM64_15130 [Chloroflexia bacterium]|nr:hypothetical protein [Chloroflexia bacterium]
MAQATDFEAEHERPPTAEREMRAPISPNGRVPGKREVDLYVRTYTTLLQSSGAVPVSTLIPAHLTASSSLHAGAEEAAPDLNAFIYSAQRIPESIVNVTDILLGQSARGFRRAGHPDVDAWEIVSAPGRRRRWRYDGEQTLAVTIASASDLDDLVPSIVAYQLEWNKMHGIIADDALLRDHIGRAAHGEQLSIEETAEVGARLLLDTASWQRLQSVWGAAVWKNLELVASQRKRMMLRMIGGTHLGNARATHQWWAPAERVLHDLHAIDRPVYFVSSNTHSIVNILSGTSRRRKAELIDFIRQGNSADLKEELAQLEAGNSRSNWENLLYFAARPYFAKSGREKERQARSREELQIGIHHIDPQGPVDVGIQIIELAQLDPSQFDPRLCDDHGVCLDPRASDAIIVNVNYPLGLSAYNILSQVGMSTDELQGIYVLGKAATLNGRIGDVMISNVVYDEHSGNTYWFDNAFSYADLDPYLIYGAALDNQKAVTVKGTFLQNEGYLDFFYRENYTVVEMEAGPYLNALYEDMHLRRYPAGEAINLQTHRGNTMDLGIIHYASDTPYTRAQTLGARGMSYHGMDSTYASTVAILRRIFEREIESKHPDLILPTRFAVQESARA